MRQGQLDVGLQETFLAAAVVALALVAIREHLLAPQQPGDAVGQLDFAAHATLLVRDLVKHARRQDVASRHAQARGRVFGGRLLDDAVDVHQAVVDRRAVDDAVATGVFGGHLLNRDDRHAPLVVLLDHLPQDRLVADHQVVGQQHRERVVADQPLPAQHRMAEAQRLGLAHVDALHVVGLDTAHDVEQFLFTRLFEGYLQLESHVKVIFDGPLVSARHENHLPDACGIGLLHRILNQRLVDDGQHLLRLGLRGRQKTSAQTGDGKDGFVD